MCHVTINNAVDFFTALNHHFNHGRGILAAAQTDYVILIIFHNFSHQGFPVLN
jgi:hypothetical protein